MTKQAAANILRQLANEPGVIDITASRLARSLAVTRVADKPTTSRRLGRR